MTNVHVGTLSIPASSAVGIFTATSVTPYPCNVEFSSSDGGVLTLVNSSSATGPGFNLSSLYTDGSEVYVWNSSSSAITIYVLFTPVSQPSSPTSYTTTVTY